MSTTVQHLVLLIYNTLHRQCYCSKNILANGLRISGINDEFVVVHWDLSKSSWTVRVIYISSNHTAFNIACVKRFLWILLQCWWRVFQQTWIFWNWLWINGSPLRFIPNWWDFKRAKYKEKHTELYMEKNSRRDKYRVIYGNL